MGHINVDYDHLFLIFTIFEIKKSSCLPSRSQESYNQGAYATSRKCFLGAEVPMSMPVVSGCVSFYNARLNKVKSRDPLVSIYSPSILIYSPLDFQ